MTNHQENKIKIVTFIILLCVSIFTLTDIVIDMNEGVPFHHLIHEAAIWVFSMGGAYYQFRIITWQKNEMDGYQEKIQELDSTNRKLKSEQKEFQKKISHLSTEFLLNIDDQFNKWSFSRGEKEIALLLIK